MRTWLRSWRGQQFPLILSILVRIFILLLPATLLFIGAVRAVGPTRQVLGLGGGFQVVVCLLTFLSRRSWHEPVGPSIISLYLIALGWVWFGSAGLDDWFEYLAQAVLLFIPLMIFGLQILTSSGATVRRRSNSLAQRLGNRKDWPDDLNAIRNLPEIKAFRESIHQDATPALSLLYHPSLQVRYAALAAMEFRANWEEDQAQLVFDLARKAREPVIRAAAVMALANLQERVAVEELAIFLYDPSPEVRRATFEALLWDCEKRWPWVRYAVRVNFGSTNFEVDGPLHRNGQLLPDEVVNDLHAWTAEKGVLGLRAAQSLGIHYGRLLYLQETDELVRRLQTMLLSMRTPQMLRMELAQLLRGAGKWTEAMQERLVDRANPASLRLMAAEALLSQYPDHKRALATLHDLGRLSNRELALATADVAQRYLGVDLGLPARQPPPAMHSAQAAEISRRVMLWALQQEREREAALATAPQAAGEGSGEWGLDLG